MFYKIKGANTMEKTYEKIDASLNENVQMLQKYINRFGYKKDDANNIKDFVIKVDNQLDYFFKNGCHYNFFKEEVTYTAYQLLGWQYDIYKDNSNYRMSYLNALLLSCSDDLNLIPVLMVCDLLIVSILREENRRFIKNGIIEEFIHDLAENLLTSNINVELYKTPNGYEFYPATESIFDEALVTDVLNWLSDYTRTKEQYDKTLKMILHQAAPRDSIDNLRLSLELFMKEFFNNEKSLENQKSLTGEYLTSHNVSKHFSSMYTTLFTHYTTYNNNEAKHNNTAEEQEIDFLLYLTGSFIRFLVKLKRDELKI